ncbi:MAG: peptidylprolyl isomerase [Pyrinomonadaceae bacterium]|nr:peptidylprolyl isomerase [Phycisphaerales bacterium]
MSRGAPLLGQQHATGLRPRFIRSIRSRAYAARHGCPAAFRAALVMTLLITTFDSLSGCAGADDQSRKNSPPTWNKLDDTNRATRAEIRPGLPRTDTTGDARARDTGVALIGGEPVGWNELTPSLAEAAGGIVLEEAALERVLTRELKNRTLTIADSDIEHEKQMLVDSLGRGIALAGEQTSEIIDRIRRTRGLGEVRFAGLMRRNAMLRRLVRDDVQITPADIQTAHAIRYGQRYRARLILVRSEPEAAEILARLRGKDARAPEQFASVAAQRSIDPSAARGGEIGTVSAADPSYPLAVREAVVALSPGAFSAPVALEQGYAILSVDEVIPATSTSIDLVSADLERDIRVVREKSEMNKLAERLLRSVTVTPLDGSLNWGWNSWQNQGK